MTSSDFVCCCWDNLEIYRSDYTVQILVGYSIVYVFMQTFRIPGTVFMSLLGALFGVFKGMALVISTLQQLVLPLASSPLNSLVDLWSSCFGPTSSSSCKIRFGKRKKKTRKDKFVFVLIFDVNKFISKFSPADLVYMV